MHASEVTLTAQAPAHTPDGSNGYFLSVLRQTSGRYFVDVRQPRVSGWVLVGNDGHTVFATLDSATWQQVGTVDSPHDLTPDWINQHAEDILRPF